MQLDQHHNDITAKRRTDLDGKPWQIDIVIDGQTRSHLIDRPADMQHIMTMPRGEPDRSASALPSDLSVLLTLWRD